MNNALCNSDTEARKNITLMEKILCAVRHAPNEGGVTVVDFCVTVCQLSSSTEAPDVAHADQASCTQDDLLVQIYRTARHRYWLVRQSL